MTKDNKAPELMTIGQKFFGTLTRKKEECVDVIESIREQMAIVKDLDKKKDPKFKSEEDKLHRMIDMYVAESAPIILLLQHMIECHQRFKETHDGLVGARKALVTMEGEDDEPIKKND